jgi:outer membrane protein assembly factor BamB
MKPEYPSAGRVLTKFFASFTLFISVQASFAQTKPVWESELPGSIQWQKVTSLGHVIASTGTSLIGLDPETGKTNWTLNQVQYTVEDNFENISGTPFFSVTDNKGALYIIEPFEGKILFSSTDAGLEKISDKYFLYKSSAIFILGYAPGAKAPSAVMVDMGTGKRAWSKDGEFSKISSCYDLGNDEFLVSTLFYVYKMGVKTGEVKWKKCIDAKFEKFSSLLDMMDKGAGNSSLGNKKVNGALVLTDNAKDLVFMAAQKESEKTVTGSDGKKTTVVEYSTVYNAFKLSTGDYAWASVVEINGRLGLLIPDKKGLIITHGTANQNNSAVNMIDYTSGQLMWGKKGKGLEVKGSPVGTAEVNGKIILSSANESKSFVYSLNPSTGLMDFEKPAKISGGIQHLEIAGNNILVCTEEEIDLFNTESGEFTFEKTIRGNQNNILSKEGNVYLFNNKDNMLYYLEKNSTAPKPFSKAPVKFQGKEDVNRMEMRDKGILLYSEQNIAMVDMSGGLTFNKYYPAPDQPNWKKALLIANAAYGAYATAVYGYSSAAFGAVSQSITVTDANSKMVKDVTSVVSQAYGNAAASGMSFTKKCIETAGKRFKASQTSSNSIFMMVELGKKQYGLVQINKDTGEKMATIDMAKDKSPSYDVDIIENTVYYKMGDKKLQAYKFN